MEKGTLTDKLHDMVNKDTPSNVVVPNNPFAFLAWAATRFGAHVLVIALVSVFLNRVYNDMQRQNEVFLTAFIAQTKVVESQVSVLQNLEKAIESNTAEIREAHRRAATK